MGRFMEWLRGLLHTPRYMPCDVCHSLMRINGYGLCEDCLEEYWGYGR